MSAGLLRGLATSASILLVVFALVTARNLTGGASEMRGSDVAFDAGELDEAVRHARRAAALYVPGASHVRAAYARLRAIAVGAERARDLPLSRAAWRGIRASALESRHAWQPHAGELREANSNLDRLDGSQLSPGTSEGRLLAARPVGVLGLACGFGAMLLGFVLVIWRSKNAYGGWVARPARGAVLLLVLGLAGFALSLVVA